MYNDVLTFCFNGLLMMTPCVGLTSYLSFFLFDPCDNLNPYKMMGIFGVNAIIGFL